MKKTIISAMLLIALTASAQFKLPSRNDIKKEVKKEVKDLRGNDNTKSNRKDAEPISETKTTTPIPTEEVKSPAKGQISTFWKQIEKMRNHTYESNKQVVYSGGIQSAQASLNNTKTKDSNYDTSAMEKALKECQDVYNGVASNKEGLRSNRMSNLKTLLTLFDWNEKNLTEYEFDSQESDAEKLNRVKRNLDSIVKYVKIAENYAAQSKDDVMYDKYLMYIKDRAKAYQKPYSSKDKWPEGIDVMKIIEDPTNAWSYGMFTYVQEIKIKEAYFYAARVVYPNVPEFEKALEWCRKASDQIGSVDLVLARINKSASDYLKKVKFPAAKVKDAILEAEFKKHFEGMGYNETVTKINIQSTDWTIDREWTGVILGRSKQAFIATKKPNGDCYVTEFWIFQDYNGSGYGFFRNVTNNSYRSKIDCANIK